MANYEWTDQGVSEWNRIRTKVDGLRGDGVANSGNALSVGGSPASSPEPAFAAGRWCPVRITDSSDTGTGQYNGRLQKRKVYTEDSSTDVDVADLWQDINSSDDVLVDNLPESSGLGGAPLKDDGTQVVWAVPTGRATEDSPPLPVLECAIGSSGLFPCLVTVDGGDTGSMNDDQDCDLTYSLYDLGGNPLKDSDGSSATGKTPDAFRVPKCTYNEPADESPGIAYKNASGDWQLYDAAQERIPGAVTTVGGLVSFDGSSLSQQTQEVLVMDKKDPEDNTIC